MTEREYIEFLQQKAKAYIEAVDAGNPRMKPIAEWEHAKSMLSAHTLVRLCETWLEADRAVEQQARDA